MHRAGRSARSGAQRVGWVGRGTWSRLPPPLPCSPPRIAWSSDRRWRSEARAVLSGRSGLAEDAEAVDPRSGVRARRRRAGSRLDHSAAVVAERRREGAQPGRGVLHRGAAGDGVRRRRQLSPGLGRRGAGVRVAEGRAHHPRRLQGQRLDFVGGRTAPARAHRKPDPEVHAGRQVPVPGRPPRQEQGQPRHRELQQRRRHLRLSEDERSVRRRRLRQSPRDRPRRRHRRVQADVGRVRQHAGRQGAESARSRRDRDRSSSTWCTAFACRTTVWSTSPIA